MSLAILGGVVAQSCPNLATPWTVARQVPLSVGFSRQEHWSGVAISFSRVSIFPTQESNLSLQHCRRILYQPSYKGSPSHSYCHIIIVYQRPKGKYVLKWGMDFWENNMTLCVIEENAGNSKKPLIKFLDLISAHIEIKKYKT